MSNVENEEVEKGGEPPGVGGGGRKVNNKCIDLKQREDMALNGLGAACGMSRRTPWYHPEMTYAETADAEAD